jgi:hypothetical protein
LASAADLSLKNSDQAKLKADNSLRQRRQGSRTVSSVRAMFSLPGFPNLLLNKKFSGVQERDSVIARTRASAATIDRKKGTGFQSTDAVRLGALLACRNVFHSNPQVHNSRSLCGATSRKEGIGYAEVPTRWSFLRQLRDLGR